MLKGNVRKIAICTIFTNENFFFKNFLKKKGAIFEKFSFLVVCFSFLIIIFCVCF